MNCRNSNGKKVSLSDHEGLAATFLIEEIQSSYGDNSIYPVHNTNNGYPIVRQSINGHTVYNSSNSNNGSSELHLRIDDNEIFERFENEIMK